MTKEEKLTLQEERAKSIAILQSGFGGLDKQGNITDRREGKVVKAFAENKALGIPEPQKVK